MRYRIGEISRLLGISPQSIRFYEKYGILAGAINEENGYRWYDIGSIYTLLSSRQYQNCGFSLGEASEMLRCSTAAQARKAYKKKERELEFQIQLQERYLRRMREISGQLATAEENAGQLSTVMSPDFCAVLYSFHNREERISEEMAQKVSRWGRHMPLAGIMLYYTDYLSENPAFWIRHGAAGCGIFGAGRR